ncbi:MAG: hypothetical protein KAX38_07515 [Candidatus Krumholzibacteria bacterium]|nr:hypothetical protein [Candidatus Krumholzibacteria bacterium]
MLDLMKLLAAASLALLVIGCASYPPSERLSEEDRITTAAEEDSLEKASLDELFIELYGDVLRELERMEKNGERNIGLIETRSIVRIAEEVYLEGNTFLAIKLLNEAELHLRQAP